MANISKYIPDIFSFYLRIPFIEINMELLTNSWCEEIFNWLLFRIKIYKYSTEFKLRLTKRKLYNSKENK